MDVKMCPKRCQPDPQPIEEFRLRERNGKQYRVGACRRCRQARQNATRHANGVSTVRGRPCSGMRTCRGCFTAFPLTDEHFHPTVVLNGKQYFHNYCHDCRNARARVRHAEKRAAFQDTTQFKWCAYRCSKRPLPLESFHKVGRLANGQPRRRAVCKACFSVQYQKAEPIPLSELVCNWKDALRCNQCEHVAADYHALFRHKHEAHSSLPYGLSAFSITPSTLGAFANELG